MTCSPEHANPVRPNVRCTRCTERSLQVVRDSLPFPSHITTRKDRDMIKNPSNASEIIAMRNAIQNGLSLDELRAINWHALANVAVPALDRGWTGDELARWALGDISDRTDSIGASMHATITRIGESNPPRQITPTPPPVQEVLRLMRAE